MLIKIHNAYRLIVAVCDEDLIGKKFEQDIKQLDLTGAFFKGEEKTEKETEEIILDQLKEDATFNVVGKKSCNLFRKLGLITEEGITYVDSVPVALILS
ncbi:MAG: DUF424 family protein [archaeon]|nr:DUF424 family protein [archaeon]